MPRSLLPVAALLLASLTASAQTHGIPGTWQEPGGSVIRIAPCAQFFCATLVKLGPHAASPFDIHNPSPAKHADRLCGLRIGYGFRLDTPDHASAGMLYDPKTGKTYHGEMTANGDRLDLRGYVGIPLFGRSEQWKRVPATDTGCR